MRNIKLTIEYDGRRYLGWQRLGDSEKTVQGKIEKVIGIMTEEKIEIIGSGRTDSGAHAKGQVANFKTESLMPLDEMIDYLNRYLPNDIVVNAIEEVPERFHSRYNAKEKTYSYYVWNSSIPSVFNGMHSFQYFDDLDLEKMQEASEKMVGTHDFLAFSALKKSKKSTERTLKEVEITQEGHLIRFKFVGDGFLYNMVRILMGTLLQIGSGELDVSVVEKALTSKKRIDAGPTAPSHGLFLEEVVY
ncbi:tRNA pseudouridine(38-40) synthase TruA [Vagococcus sp. DIV0080]|uniref:tRNA pseudouridine synthase A n=1 Tax=Candidatus Vagococcus giribetii TaxID=2230876 RepID=A0ABS3HVJ1_9ENTE|nr:tRNA pseudouridine(38-40) synthase TruA [Vagococcus sp. DIV0080]MBO0477774.1 tRNA pseudouridine(38-40) synthase TruA [Vagococcus sp. DIV0080]